MSAPDDNAIFEEAAEWWLSRHDGGADVRAAFARWLAVDPRHGEAFDAVAAAWDATGEEDAAAAVDGPASIEILADVRQARSRQRTLVRRIAIAGGIAASAAACLIWVGLSAKQVSDFSTGHGQHLATALADGSTIELDANSHVHVEYSAGHRDVALLNGRALFDVAHNAHRPFVVKTANGVVTVLGTMFSVEYRDADTSVDLFRGHVQAGPRGRPAAVDLLPGDALRISSGDTVEMSHHVDVERATLWRQGRLVFDNDTLDRVVARMNDYGDDRITIRDRAAAHLAVSGIFQAGRDQAFLHALQTYYGLEVRRNGRAVVIASRVPKS